MVAIDSTTKILAKEYPGLVNQDENERLKHERIRREGVNPGNVNRFLESVQMPELYVVQAVAFSRPLETGAPPIFAGINFVVLI